MQLIKALPYKKWLPKTLRDRNWSQEKLAIAMKTKRSYWSHTITGRSPVPNAKVLEKIAKYFDVSPYEILEYKQYKAIEKLKKNPELLDVVLSEQTTKKEPRGLIIDGKPLTEAEEATYQAAGIGAVRGVRASPVAGETTVKRKGGQGQSAAS